MAGIDGSEAIMQDSFSKSYPAAGSIQVLVSVDYLLVYRGVRRFA